jgi:hypothetical protein
MNFIRKIHMKYSDPQAYAIYKESRRDEDLLNRIRQVNAEPLIMPRTPDCSFKHSGNCGDIIFAMPAMFALAGTQKEKNISLYLRTGQEVPYQQTMKHPLGNVSLNEQMVQMITPLVLSQKHFARCETFHGQAIDYDLDRIRDYPLLLDRGNISRWYFLVFPEYYDLSNPWLSVEPSPVTKDAIVVARSSRYRMPLIDYRFLREYPNIYFVGLEEEYLDMREQIPAMTFLKVGDFLELAQLIAGSRLFIGNQGLPFTLAEALKVNRLLELYFKAPTNSVAGKNGFDFCFQQQFEYLVKTRYEKGADT